MKSLFQVKIFFVEDCSLVDRVMFSSLDLALSWITDQYQDYGFSFDEFLLELSKVEVMLNE